MPFIQVPTTLEADVDASVGGKVAVNHVSGKNMIGAFYQPRRVVIDVTCLATLDERDLKAGLAESVKHGMIRDAAFFEWHESRAEKILACDEATMASLIERNVQIKAAVVAADERESHLRAILNFGHTFGHAVESEMRYQWRHGECVSVGMMCACRIAQGRGMMQAAEVARVESLLEKLGLATRIPETISVQMLLDWMKRDKKVKAGKIQFVLPKGIGEVCITDDITESESVLGGGGNRREIVRRTACLLQNPVAKLPGSIFELHMAEGVGPIAFSRLIEHFGSVAAVLDASVGALQEVEGIGRKTAEAVRVAARSDAWRSEIDLAAEHGVRIICREDAEYPRLLHFVADPPICLYVRGRIVKEDGLAIGIVGPRKASLYGLEQAQRFGELLCQAGLTVVSGMARGVDQAAHMAAIRVGGRTMAVLGCGLCHCYPPESTELRDRISQCGAVVSELPMSTPPATETFPKRNRIIAGMSLGTLVIEAAQRSGALITARLANEYNREVFALPGRVDTRQSEGTNDLIRRGYAKLVTNLTDILDELGEAGEMLAAQAAGGSQRPTEKTLFGADDATDTKTDNVAAVTGADSELQGSQAEVYGIVGGEPMHIEQVAAGCRLGIGEVSAALTLLQLRGLVRQMPGNLFVRRTAASSRNPGR